jgi:anti-anti-sigma factor
MLKVQPQQLRNITTLCLQGLIGVSETRVLRHAVHAQTDIEAVVLDLTQVIGIDAAGLGLLLELREWTRAKGIEFRLLNPTERVREVLDISCLNSVFQISSEAEVLFLATSGRPSAGLAIVHCGHVLGNATSMIA